MYGRYRSKRSGVLKSKRASAIIRRRRNRRVARRVRKTIAPMETACLKQTFEAGVIEPNAPYEPQITLQQFSRALDVADNYQEYRVSRVEYLYTPKYDTFGALYSPSTSNVQVSVPYLYTKKQTAYTPDSYTLAFLTAQGAKPIRLDDKTIKHTYRPHIIQKGMDYATQSGLSFATARPVRSPWLATHVQGQTSVPADTTVMDSTIHYTHNFWIQQDVVNPAVADVCSLVINVYFEFRKPWDLASSTPGSTLKRNPLVKSV